MFITSDRHELKNPRFFAIEKMTSQPKMMLLRQLGSEDNIPDGFLFAGGWLDIYSLKLTFRRIIRPDGHTWGYAIGEELNDEDITSAFADEGFRLILQPVRMDASPPPRPPRYFHKHYRGGHGRSSGPRF